MAVVTDRPEPESTYLDYLPAVFRESAAPGEPGFLGRYLLGFEHVLTGTGDPDEPGIRSGSRGFRPQVSQGSSDTSRRVRTCRRRASAGGLLAVACRLGRSRVAIGSRRAAPPRADRAGRAALPSTRHEGRPRAARRRLHADGRHRRGARRPLPARGHSRVGVDTVLGGGAPHFFRVVVRLPTTDPAEIAAQRRLITAIVDSEKPSYSHYTLDVETPTLQIGVTSTVGVDTLLGAESE